MAVNRFVPLCLKLINFLPSGSICKAPCLILFHRSWLFFFWVYSGNAQMPDGALTGIVIGIVSAAFFLGFSGREWMPAIHFLYVAAIIFGLSCLAVFAVSLLTPPPEDKVREFTWQQKIYERETIEISRLPFMLNYRYLSALLIAFLILILLVFW
jgi:Na+/proline symporter